MSQKPKTMHRTDNFSEWKTLWSYQRLSHITIPIVLKVSQQMLRRQESALLPQVQDDHKRRPVCYASRSLRDTEKRNAVIEKEAIAATWAWYKFYEYVLGQTWLSRPITDLSYHVPRIQRFRLRLMMRSAPMVQYVPGKQHVLLPMHSQAHR